VRPVIHRPLTPATHIMTEQSGDNVRAHTPIDGLGGQCVPKLVRGDVANPGLCGLFAENLGNTMGGDRTVPFDQQAVRPDFGGSMVCDPIVEEFLSCGRRECIGRYAACQAEPQPIGGAGHPVRSSVGR
jgi:hypothetical protein